MPATCSVPGCYKVSYARTWCNTHYNRWYDHGDPMRVPYSGLANRLLGPLLCICAVPNAHPARAFGQCFTCYRKPFALMAPTIRARYPQFAQEAPGAD